jgi:NAD(P)-dependent dehydrogenase (short-subunit alcohol dehydrogenase family)
VSKFKNKTAVISGGAEGIGLAIARALGKQGMNIVLADIDPDTLATAERLLQEEKIPVEAVEMDVALPADWKRLSERTLKRFGKVHMLVNNAGVSGAMGPIEMTRHNDWQWVMDVNFYGVLYGTETFVPLIKEHGEGGWLLNVSSMAGMAGVPYGSAYTATKVAVVGMSEAWHAELAPHNIMVSVLCPEFVKTRIHLSHRNRQERYKTNPSKSSSGSNGKNPAKDLVENGIPTEVVGARVVEALEAGELYIFTHPAHRENAAKRGAAIDAAFARAAKSDSVAHLLDRDPVMF